MTRTSREMERKLRDNEQWLTTVIKSIGEDNKRKTQTEGAMKRLIPFSLADGWYAANIENVLEVLEVPSITSVPGLPDFILGVINIRGDITSVTDLRQLSGLGKTSITSESRIIVICAAGKATALVVDTLGKALALPFNSIHPDLSGIPAIKTDYIKGEARPADGHLLTILDMEKIMSSQEMKFE